MLDFSETLTKVIKSAKEYAAKYDSEYVTIENLVAGLIKHRQYVFLELDALIVASEEVSPLSSMAQYISQGLYMREQKNHLAKALQQLKELWKVRQKRAQKESKQTEEPVYTKNLQGILVSAGKLSENAGLSEISTAAVIFTLMLTACDCQLSQIACDLLGLDLKLCMDAQLHFMPPKNTKTMMEMKMLSAMLKDLTNIKAIHPDKRKNQYRNEIFDGDGSHHPMLDMFWAIEHKAKNLEFSNPDLKDNNKRLQRFCRELVQEARDNRLDPLVGRKEELDRIIQVMLRRKKNNPILIGDPGVGKTAIVEGLAIAIAKKEVPEAFDCQEVYMLDLAGMVAGTKYRGEFEDRLVKLLKELENRPTAILFLDEFHSLWGAGGNTEGGMDGAAILKPYFTSGQVRFIGTTTYESYRKTIMKDTALTRRLQTIDVPELGAEQTVEVLMGLKSQYEDHHKVTFTPEALKETVKLTSRHIHGFANPDKSVDILDEAGSRHLAFQDRYENNTIDVDEIRSVVAKIARIPDLNTVTDDTELLRTLDKELKETVFGQEDAVDTVVSAVKLSRAGLKPADRPICNFLFAGPTGVGKTELAKQLAAKLNIKFIRFDMSEHADKSSVTRLIGADPGYVGYEAGGQLTNAIIKNPHAVLLLDEIEKAHSSIFNVLLQVMDAARLTDNTGREASFRNVILIMTSNVGARRFDQTRVGFDNSISSEWDERELKQTFSPEFRNRLDSIVTFKPLPREIVALIVDKFISEMEFQLAEKNIKFNLTDEARNYFATAGYDQKFGARPLERVIRDQIKRPLADEILFGKLTKGGVVDVSLVDNEVKFDIKAHQK